MSEISLEKIKNETGFTVENGEFESVNKRQIESLLKIFGIWGKTKKEKDGSLLTWSPLLTSKLETDAMNGERKFAIAKKEPPEGEQSETLESRIQTCLMDIFFVTEDGRKFKLEQYLSKRTSFLGYNRETREFEPLDYTEELTHPVKKSSSSSVSGKINMKNGESPLDALQKEIKQELGLNPSEYIVEGEPKAETVVGESPGFPGLQTRNTFYRYNVTLKKSGYRPNYREESQPIQDLQNKVQETKVHTFLWSGELK